MCISQTKLTEISDFCRVGDYITLENPEKLHRRTKVTSACHDEPTVSGHGDKRKTMPLGFWFAPEPD